MVRLWFAIVMICGLAACSATADDPTATVNPTTAVPLAQITPTVTPTPAPTLPPLAAVARRPDAPLTARRPPCTGAPETRMILNTRGRVMDEDLRPLNVRSGPSTDYRILGRLETRDIFLVVDGPECGGDYVWYLIERLDGSLRGWVAEGEDDFYYVEPYFP